MPKRTHKNRLAYSPRRHALKHNEKLRYIKFKKKGILNVDQQRAFELFFFKDQTEYQIAKKLNLSQPSISVLIKQAKKVIKTGKPTIYYRRKDTLSREVPWSKIYRHRGNIGYTMMEILRMRHKEHKTTTEIAEYLKISQPQVSSILTACSLIISGTPAKA